MKRGELRKLSDSARRKVSRNFGFRQSGYINWIVKDGSPDKLGGKILNFPEKVIPLCHE